MKMSIGDSIDTKCHTSINARFSILQVVCREAECVLRNEILRW
jgi:hypothetical protein